MGAQPRDLPVGQFQPAPQPVAFQFKRLGLRLGVLIGEGALPLRTLIQRQQLGELRVREGPAGDLFLRQGAGQLVQQILPEPDLIGQRAEGKAVPPPIEKPPLRPVGKDQIGLLAAALPGAGDLLCGRLLISPPLEPISNGHQRLVLSVAHAVHGQDTDLPVPFGPGLLPAVPAANQQEQKDQKDGKNMDCSLFHKILFIFRTYVA